MLLTRFFGPSPFTTFTVAPLTSISESAGESDVGVVEDTEQSWVPTLLPSLPEGGITSRGGFPLVAGVTYKESLFGCSGPTLPFLTGLSSDAVSFWFAQMALSSSRSLDVVSELLSHELVSLRLCPRSSSRKRLQLEELCESESDQLNLRFCKDYTVQFRGSVDAQKSPQICKQR